VPRHTALSTATQAAGKHVWPAFFVVQLASFCQGHRELSTVLPAQLARCPADCPASQAAGKGVRHLVWSCVGHRELDARLRHNWFDILFTALPHGLQVRGDVGRTAF
jgi:hypothetical protein